MPPGPTCQLGKDPPGASLALRQEFFRARRQTHAEARGTGKRAGRQNIRDLATHSGCGIRRMVQALARVYEC